MYELEIWLEGMKKLRDKAWDLCLEFIRACWNR